MIDFQIKPLSGAMMLYCSALYLFIVIHYWKKGTCLSQVECWKNNSVILFVGIVVLFTVTSFYNGDFYHYHDMVKSYSGSGSLGLESIYQLLIEITNKNYLLFRICVFGSATVLLYYTFRQYTVSAHQSLFFFFAIFISDFDYSRASLAMVVYFLGLSIMLNSPRRLSLETVTGLVLIFLSSIFHRSAIIMICVTPFMLSPLKKKTIVPFLLLLVMFYSLLKSNFIELVNSAMASNYEDIADKVERYTMNDRTVLYGNIFGWIAFVWQYLKYYIIFIADTIYLFSKKNRNINTKKIIYLYRITFALMVFSTLMLLFNIGDLSLFYRFLYMTFVPLTIITYYLFSKGLMSRKVYVSLILYGAVYLGWNFIHRTILLF